jgi:high-affinity nickel permease
MFGILGLGFLLGMQHALEADHIVAVATRSRNRWHGRRPRPYRAVLADLANRSLQGAVGLVTIAIGLHAIVTTTLSKPAHLHSLTLRPALTPANGLHVRLTGRFERPS